MLYIMRRTQLYLDDELWAALQVRARLEKSTISELVRLAARERYVGTREQRRAAMLGIAGLWKDRDSLEDTDTMIRNLRKDTREERLTG